MSKKESVAKEIIEINDILKEIDVELMGARKGAIINIGLNRLSALSAEAEKLLRGEE